MGELRELIERVEKATGPMTGKEVEACIRLSPWYDTHPSHDPVWGFFCRALQGSVDAALALVEKVLPGATWFAANQPDEAGQFGFDLRSARASADLATASAPTFALAIILALLRAIDNQGVGRG